jgi:tetratricopeptide (TPR) repeat protein
MFRDVRYRGLAARLAEESEMISARVGRGRLFALAALLLAALASFAAPARAGNLTLPPEAHQALDKIYGGDPDSAIALARGLQQAQPENPLGYLLEGEALWWKRYCAACEIKYGMVEAWKRSKDPGDAAYLALADKAIELASAQIAKSDTAEMHVFAGMGWALKVRVYALRGETRNAAHAGVSARAEMLRALQLDPQMADATAGVGIYNYYVETLSPIVKLLRFFMGIPGGDKELGVKQMETGMNQGVLLAVDVRFILARALRQYDRKYAEALGVAEPLVARYPHNPPFLLLLGNLNAELGRNEKAAQYFNAALAASDSAGDSLCPAHTRALANSFLSSLH